MADEGPPLKKKRFTFKSYEQSLKSVHLPSPTVHTAFDEEISDDSSHFHTHLEHLRQLSLAPSFVKYVDTVHPLSQSMPMLLHNWSEVTSAWLEAARVESNIRDDGEGYKPLLELMKALVYDLRTTLLSRYSELTEALAPLLTRKLNPSAFTELLATLLAMFKYILIPSLPSPLLHSTWSLLRTSFIESTNDGRRMLGEVWGMVVRRLKPEIRETLVSLMVSSLHEDAELSDAIAWIFVASCHAPSRTLHPSAGLIISSLVDHHLSAQSPVETGTLIRRLLTSFAHHVAGAPQYLVVSDVLVQRLTTQLASLEAGDSSIAQLKRLFSVLETPCSVRNGSRLSPGQLSTILDALATMKTSIMRETEEEYASLATTALVNSEMSVWMSKGKNVLQRCWELEALGLRVTGALANMEWDGWTAFALPGVIIHLPPALKSSERRVASEALRLLCFLHKAGRLKTAAPAWFEDIGNWAATFLGTWSLTEENVVSLVEVLSALPVLSNAPLVTWIGRIISDNLRRDDAESAFVESALSPALIIAECLFALASNASDSMDQLDIPLWVEQITSSWSWNPLILEAILALILINPDRALAGVTLEMLASRLREAILSHDRRLRLCALRLMATKASLDDSVQLDGIRACLAAEEVELDIAGVRERILKTNKVIISIREEDTGTGRTLSCLWLLAQLKVNLRPLWSPAAESISSLISRFPDDAWQLVFEELRKASRRDPIELRSAVPSWVSREKDVDDALQETEKSWRCTTTRRLFNVISHWKKSPFDVAVDHLVEEQRPRDRLDDRNYEIQILNALSLAPSVTAKNSRHFVPFFIGLGPEQVAKPRLKAYLTLISKFNNPKALHSTTTLHSLHYSLLANGDRPLQLLALECVMTYKSPALLRQESRLRTILDDTKWRDELAFVNLEDVETEQRKEVVEVLIRLLYGVMMDRRGRNRGATDRRAAVLSIVAQCTSIELVTLVQLMLEPFGADPDAPPTILSSGDGLGEATLSQQAGFLNLLGDVLRHLAPQLLPYWPVLLSTTFEITSSAQKRIDESRGIEPEDPSLDLEIPVPEDNPGDGSSDVDLSHNKMLRPLRQMGLKRLADFFRVQNVEFDFEPYVQVAFPSMVTPRLEFLERENIQAPSALMELFLTWTISPRNVPFLVKFDARVLTKLYACLNGVNVKPAVVFKILDLIDRLLELSAEEEDIATTVLRPHNATLLEQLASMFHRVAHSPSKVDSLGQRQIAVLSSLSSYIEDADQAARLLGLLLPLLRKPSKVVPEKTKVDLLQVARRLMQLVPDCANPGSLVFNQCFESVSTLFQALRSRPARVELVAVFEQLCTSDASLGSLASTIASLNSFSTKRMAEPDFERRLSAFNSMNETLFATFAVREWLPIIYNMLFFIQDPEELAIRGNAAFSLRRFVDFVSNAPDPSDPSSSPQATFNRVLFPALRNGLRSKLELVRSDILGVIAYSVEKCTNLAVLQELRPLLANGDAEANFFNNIHHIQVHRRTRALRRLAEFCADGAVRSSTLSDLFIPLIGHFVSGTENIDHHLINEAITTTGSIARHIVWSSYNALVQRYLKGAKEKSGSEKVSVRTLVAILDNFHFSLEDVVDEERDEVDDDDDDSPGDATKPEPAFAFLTPKMRTKISDAVNQRLLPNLLLYIEKRDEAEESLRIPVAVGIVKVALHLPEATRRPQIEKLITVLSQILRSKSQETRDLVRETLCRITVMLGLPALPMILKELRAALLRGPQLHVLAFVVHSLIVHVTTPENAAAFPDLDVAIADVADVSAEVIFGQSGRDVQSEDFRTKMREVRGSSSRGLDTFGIMAKSISPSKISGLLRPVRAIMHETEALKIMQKVDDVLRRVANGLNANPRLNPAQILILCHTFINQNAKFLRQDDAPRQGKRKKTDFDVQMKRNTAVAEDSFANNSPKFIAFGLDLFVTAFRRSQFDFSDKDILAKLEPMASVIGNTLYSSNAVVVSLGLRAAAAISRCPIKAVPKSLPVYIRQILAVIKQAGSTESEVVQNAFKSLATIIRDCPDAKVQESDLTFLLEVITPDLEEKDRQIAVFALLRAIVSRKFVVPEMYDIMDKIAEILVTNQSTQVQELCRVVLLQFLLDYPQGKGRLKSQMGFLAKNLSYVFESGRLSVMELLSAVFSKFQVGLVHEYADLFFVALFMVLANDESPKCREMGAELVKSLFSRLDPPRRSKVMEHLKVWAAQRERVALPRTVAQVYGLIVDVPDSAGHPYIPVILSDLNDILRSSANILREYELSADELDDKSDELDWQLPYQTLSSLSKVVKAKPDVITSSDGVLWEAVAAHSLFPHAWVRLASSRLLGSLFSAHFVGPPNPSLPSAHPLSTEGLVDLSRKFCIQLRSTNLDEALNLQLVKNLFYAGKCFHAWPRVEKPMAEPIEELDDDDQEDGANQGEELQRRDRKALDNPLAWLFSKLSYDVRSAHIARRNRTSNGDSWAQHILAIFRWFAAMTTYMPTDDVEKYLTHILSPVYRVLEDDTIRDPLMGEVKTLGQELQTLVQEKIGTTKFGAEYNRIRQNVLAVRRDRKSARAVQATSDPSLSARRKIQRNVVKKNSRKRKNQEFTNEKIKQGLKRARFE